MKRRYVHGDRFGYTGQIWFKELGLFHYKARMYSPKLGRFLQTDPIFYADQMNLYAYVGNDPVNMTDPTGMSRYYHQEIKALKPMPKSQIGSIKPSAPVINGPFKIDTEGDRVDLIKAASAFNVGNPAAKKAFSLLAPQPTVGIELNDKGRIKVYLITTLAKPCYTVFKYSVGG